MMVFEHSFGMWEGGARVTGWLIYDQMNHFSFTSTDISGPKLSLSSSPSRTIVRRSIVPRVDISCIPIHTLSRDRRIRFASFRPCPTLWHTLAFVANSRAGAVHAVMPDPRSLVVAQVPRSCQGCCAVTCRRLRGQKKQIVEHAAGRAATRRAFGCW